MNLSKLFISCMLVVFALTISNVPTAEAGGKSHKSKNYKSWSKSYSSNSSQSYYSNHSKKSDKSSKHSAKSKKSDKSSKHSAKSKKSGKSNKHSHKNSHKHSHKHSGKCNGGNGSNHDKVEICHISQGNGQIQLIEVNQRSVKKHLRRHGDSLAGEFFADLDGDGFGDSSMVNSCPIEGYVPTGGDCAVDNASTFPGAMEVCGDGIDNNCNGEVDEMCGIQQTFVDTIGDCDGFGSETPYSDNPDYFNLAVDEGTGQDGRRGGSCATTPVSQWTHVLDELPADATVTSMVLQLNSYGIDDATVDVAGQNRDNKLFVDGTEVAGALDLVSATTSVSIDYIDLPVSSAADRLVDISLDPAGGDVADCALYDYSELVVEYTSQSIVDSPAAGFCQNGDQPAVPVACPCGTEDDVLGFFLADQLTYLFSLQTNPATDKVSYGRVGGPLFETENLGGAQGAVCRLTVPGTPGVVVEFDQLNSAEMTACQNEIRQVPTNFTILN